MRAVPAKAGRPMSDRSGLGPYNSMEGVIEQNKDSYYLALRRTQQTIRMEEQNWEAWLVFFLKTIVKQKDNLAAKVKEEQALRASLGCSLLPLYGMSITSATGCFGEDRIRPPEPGAKSGRQRADKSFHELLERAKIQDFRFHVDRPRHSCTR
jgi:hypothetical protein